MSFSGESQALEVLVQQQIPRALRLAVRLTGHVQDAEDIVQETLLRAARSAASFRGESQFSTWFHSILLNVARTHGRSRQRRENQQAADALVSELPVDCPPDAELQLSELTDSVSKAVALLPDRQREILVLSVYEEMDAVEIAAVMQITVQNVYSSLSAARGQLKRSLLRGTAS